MFRLNKPCQCVKTPVVIAKLLISTNQEKIIGEIEAILGEKELKNPHPDLLYFPSNSKLGIEQARMIKEHFSLKPYSAKGRAVVLEDASNLTIEAQNALLKTLEELPEYALFILGVDSDYKLLPTVISRCQIVRFQGIGDRVQEESYTEDIEKLIRSSTQARFEYIEKLKNREQFLHSLILYFHQHIPSHIGSGNTDYKDFLKDLLSAEEWVNHNVNIRAILEYLMLVMPKIL